MIADMLRNEALIPAERGGPMRNVRMALDATSHETPEKRRILLEELATFSAAMVEEKQRRGKSGSVTKAAWANKYPPYRECWKNGNPETRKPWRTQEECADHLGISIPTLRKAISTEKG